MATPQDVLAATVNDVSAKVLAGRAALVHGEDKLANVRYRLWAGGRDFTA